MPHRSCSKSSKYKCHREYKCYDNYKCKCSKCYIKYYNCESDTDSSCSSDSSSSSSSDSDCYDKCYKKKKYKKCHKYKKYKKCDCC